MTTEKLLAGLLFGIHEHNELTEEIYYNEKDLLPILKIFGLPEPDWGESFSLLSFSEDEKKRIAVTVDRIRVFKDALAEIKISQEAESYIKIQTDAMTSQIESLERELEELLKK